MRDGWKYAIEGVIGVAYTILGIEADIPDCEHLATEVNDLTDTWTKSSRWARVALTAIGLLGRALSEIGHEDGSDEELEYDDDSDESDTSSAHSDRVISYDEEE